LVLNIRGHVEQTCHVLVDSLEFCTDDWAFRGALEGLLTQTVARLAGESLPWLTLPILSCEALTDAHHHIQAAQHIAAAWELGNLAAAYLDAWQDHDTDGALWQEIGPERTVNLAVGLIALSLLSLSRLDMFSFSASRIMEVQHKFQLTLLRMVEGQHVDLHDDLTLNDCQMVAGAKSGSLFRLGCWAGAFVAGATPEMASRFGDFGHNLGLLIQAWNDIYGLTGAMGKQDVGHRRTLPIVAALDLNGDQARDQEALLQSPEGRAGELYALTQVGLLHEQAAEALARCSMPGRLSLFLDAYSIGHHLNTRGEI
jgi:geranylgeranyl pyrophosphate synthase